MGTGSCRSPAPARQHDCRQVASRGRQVVWIGRHLDEDEAEGREPATLPWRDPHAVQNLVISHGASGRQKPSSSALRLANRDERPLRAWRSSPENHIVSIVGRRASPARTSRTPALTGLPAHASDPPLPACLFNAPLGTYRFPPSTLPHRARASSGDGTK